ncbi:fimbrial protein [Providencia rustigianii]|uniref:fimbrial protein n=1 Tax=Providencia rustigianii TaxID=158850 RepID=UPI0022449B9E|nr:fimbrial protein [Providencia rustigianii]
MQNLAFLSSILLLVPFISNAEYTVDGGIRGETVMRGYIVAAPCSIETDSQYQYINYVFTSKNSINTEEENNNRKKFNIKLNNCISEYDKDNRKGMKIRFLANNDRYSNAIKLSGPTDGVVIYIYDTNNNLITLNTSYSISNSAIYFDSKTKNSFLEYETKIKTINNDIEPGDYFATIKFNVSYD